MILSHSKGMYTAALLGEKTLTTRLRLPAHIGPGKAWAIVPGRAKPAWWFGVYGSMWVVVRSPREMVTMATTEQMTTQQAHSWLEWQEFTQARIRIDAYGQTPLQHMTAREALDEGVTSVADYAVLWDAINGKTKGARWDDNPLVWRIRFQVPQDVREAVSRVGRAAILSA